VIERHFQSLTILQIRQHRIKRIRRNGVRNGPVFIAESSKSDSQQIIAAIAAHNIFGAHPMDFRGGFSKRSSNRVRIPPELLYIDPAERFHGLRRGQIRIFVRIQLYYIYRLRLKTRLVPFYLLNIVPKISHYFIVLRIA
jgi:hypothetical protein